MTTKKVSENPKDILARKNGKAQLDLFRAQKRMRPLRERWRMEQPSTAFATT